MHSQLSATRDSIVYAGVQNDELQVIALDAERGRERWHRSSDVSKRIRGVELSIYTDDDTAYFLTRGAANARPVSYRSGVAATASADTLSLTAVTTATGKERWSTPLQGEADPNARTCGSSVCLFVTAGNNQQLWSFERATGRIEDNADVSLPGGAGGDAVISGIDGDHDISSFISSSRGPVVIGQHSAQGTHLDWSQPADQLFGGENVSPNGGWAGWPAGDDGWVIWLGTGVRPPSQPKAGDTFAHGAVAGAGPDGSARWLRTDRHPCAFAITKVPTLCDGIVTMTSSTSGSSRPTVMEGLDPIAGTTTWQLQLAGAVDEFDSTATVLRIDDTTFLVTTADGPRTVELHAGAKPAGNVDAIGWCQPNLNAHDSITVRGRPSDYVRSGGQFPCHLGGKAVDEPAKLPIPDFAGVHSAGYSAWVVNGTVHAERNP